MATSDGVRFVIDDKDIFPQGAKFTNTLESDLKTILKDFESTRSGLTEVFKGPIANSADDGFNTLKSIMGITFGNLEKVSEFLNTYREKKDEVDITSEKIFLSMDKNGTLEVKNVTQISNNLYVDSKTGMVFPIAKGQGQIGTYGQFGTGSQGGYGGSHNGIDIVAKVGTDIHAASDAVVVHSGWDPYTHDGTGGYGYCVVLQSKDSSGKYIYQIYGHMQSNPGLKQGSTVQAGQVIGKVGSSGNTPGGPHLHYEIRNGLQWNGDVSLGMGNFFPNVLKA